MLSKSMSEDQNFKTFLQCPRPPSIVMLCMHVCFPHTKAKDMLTSYLARPWHHNCSGYTTDHYCWRTVEQFHDDKKYTKCTP